MILVTGGLGSGIRPYVRTLGYTDADMASERTADAPVLLDAQELARVAEGEQDAPAAFDAAALADEPADDMQAQAQAGAPAARGSRSAWPPRRIRDGTYESNPRAKLRSIRWFCGGQTARRRTACLLSSRTVNANFSTV